MHVSMGQREDEAAAAAYRAVANFHVQICTLGMAVGP
jgi:hypothetical protein